MELTLKSDVIVYDQVSVGYYENYLKSENRPFRQVMTGYAPHEAPKDFDLQLATPNLPVTQLTRADAMAYAKFYGLDLCTDAELKEAFELGAYRTLPAVYEWTKDLEKEGVVYRGGYYLDSNGTYTLAGHKLVIQDCTDIHFGFRVCKRP